MQGFWPLRLWGWGWNYQKYQEMLAFSIWNNMVLTIFKFLECNLNNFTFHGHDLEHFEAKMVFHWHWLTQVWPLKEVVLRISFGSFDKKVPWWQGEKMRYILIASTSASLWKRPKTLVAQLLWNGGCPPQPQKSIRGYLTKEGFFHSLWVLHIWIFF